MECRTDANFSLRKFSPGFLLPRSQLKMSATQGSAIAGCPDRVCAAI